MENVRYPQTPRPGNPSHVFWDYQVAFCLWEPPESPSGFPCHPNQLALPPTLPHPTVSLPH